MGSVIFLLVASLASCGGDATGPVGPIDDPTDDPTDNPTPPVGSIEVATVTTGSSLDPDGYIITVGAGRQVIGVNAVATLTGMSAGNHVVELIGLTSNCAVISVNPQTVTVVAGETISASFEVACQFVDLEALGKIAFTRWEDGSGYSIWVMEGHGGNPVRLAGDGRHPVWSPDGTRIAFWSDLSPSVRAHVWIMNADGSNLANLTHDAAVDDLDPVWSPDGARIAFTRWTPDGGWGQPNIWVMDADGSKPVNLSSSSDYDDNPAWSPDGTKIAFTRSPPEGCCPDVWVMNADGSSAVSLTKGLSGGAPTWSPDGTKIAFTSPRDGNWDMYVMNADGSNSVNLTNNGGEVSNLEPTWSPDGTKIAFRRGGEIYVMGADGSNPLNVTYNLNAGVLQPRWSADGTKIVVQGWSHEDGNTYIWAMNADGSELANLTSDASGSMEPAWQPLP